MTDTTAVYMRVSTRDQDVASQRRQIDQWLEANGLTAPDHRWYADHGPAGVHLTTPSRPVSASGSVAPTPATRRDGGHLTRAATVATDSAA